MENRVHALLICWIASHLGHAILSTFYERTPAIFIVPVIYAAFILLTVGAWKRNRWAARMCAIAAVMTIVIQGLFIWKRDAYGSLSVPVLVFDILGIASSLLYLLFIFFDCGGSGRREHGLGRFDDYGCGPVVRRGARRRECAGARGPARAGVRPDKVGGPSGDTLQP